MKRREFNKNLAAATAVILSPLPRFRSANAAAADGAIPVFSYPTFLASNGLAMHNAAGINTATGIATLLNNQGHNHGGMQYNTQQPPGPFTTEFSWRMLSLGLGPESSGLTFVMQPSSTTSFIGQGDANMCGYSALIGQNPPYNSVAVKFDAGNGSVGQNYPAGGLPSSTGMYINGGPAAANGGSVGLIPFNDLNPYGINFYNEHTFKITIVYDGSLLTMVILDTVNGAQARLVWPLNLAYATNSTGNYVGLAGGTASVGIIQVLSWSYWSGFNTRLNTPTFSPAAGQYAAAQTVTIDFPSGSTCYYTTNGLLPTSSSSRYTGPITVSANAVVQAIAIQSGFTDSLVATGTYQINTANVINYPNGFSAGNLINVGFAYLSGSSYRVTDDTTNCAGAVWFPALVTVSSFSSTFTLQWDKGGQGMCFVIQNNTPAYTSPSNSTSPSTKISWSGGPTIVGATGNAMGYAGIDSYEGKAGQGNGLGILSSVAIAFDQFFVPNSVGLYTGGNNPQGNQTSASGITFSSGTPVVCTVTYDGTTLTIKLTQGSAQFSHSWTIDIPSTVGGATAYVGFTGGTGGAASIAAIRSWTHTASSAQALPATPAAPTNLKVS